MKLNRLILPAALCFSLSGCVVAAAADLAATTVFTAGKLAVKGTGALISAAIPDDDDDGKDKKARKNQPPSTQTAGNQTYPTNNIGTATEYGTHADTDSHSISRTSETESSRYITISPDGPVYREAPESAANESIIQ